MSLKFRSPMRSSLISAIRAKSASIPPATPSIPFRVSAPRARTRALPATTPVTATKSLLRASDDKFAVFSSGEGVKLDFDPRNLPALSAGWVRDYFFYADGFEKDLDFYAAHAFTVEPLPRHGLLPYPYPAGNEYPADNDHLGYQLEYNIRSRSDRLPENLRYDYPAPK